MKFWILWGGDALIASVAVYFFIAGLFDGSVSSFNITLWGVILILLAGILGGSILLRSFGHITAAWMVILILAIPGLMGAVLLLAAIVLQPNWN
jgi:hypothetical protein